MGVASGRARGRLPGKPFRGGRVVRAALGVAVGMTLWIGSAGTVLAGPGDWVPGDPWWYAWQVDPAIAANLVLISVVYAWGIRSLWRRAGVGRGVGWWRVAAFAGGMLALAVALLSPLDTLGTHLSWVHMTQHMVMMVVAAPLIVAGAPGLVATWAMPLAWRRSVAGVLFRGAADVYPGAGPIGRALWNPVVVWVVHALVLWGWHAPWLYEWALESRWVHELEHLSFFLVACLFWRIAVDARKRLTLNPGVSVLYLFTTSLHAMVLGVLMALSPTVWYSAYEGRTEAWGWTALEDQQLAGLIMWMPACSVYAVAAAILFGNWLGQLDESPRPRQSLARASS